MANPYNSPQAAESVIAKDQKKVVGGFFQTEGANAVQCFKGELSADAGYLDIKYITPKTRKKALVIFCILSILFCLISAIFLGISLGGMGYVIIYILSNTIAMTSKGKQVRLNFDENELLVDKKRKAIGVKYTDGDNQYFIATKIRKPLMNSLLEKVEHTETTIKKGSQAGHVMTAMIVIVACVAFTVCLHFGVIQLPF